MRWLLVIVLLTAGYRVIAQPKFMAYTIQGKVTYIENKKEHQLKVGKVLDEKKTVKINKGGSLTLICESSSSTVVLQEGEHHLARIAGSCNTKNSSLTGKYLEYVWWQMTRTGDAPQTYNVKGAVTRGCRGLDLFTPDTINYYVEPMVLSWKTKITDKRFVLYIGEKGAIPYLETPLTKNDFLVLDSVSGKLERSTTYSWTIRLNGKEECQRQFIQVWSTEDFSELEKELRQSIAPGSNAAEQDFMMGFLLESNYFLGEAWKYYKKAAQAEPANHLYKSTEERFKKIFRTT
jgi:hypothetical protein